MDQPPAKRCRPNPSTELPPNLGKLIDRDVALLKRLGWRQLIKARRHRGDFNALDFKHPATHLLKHYQSKGAPVVLHTPPWSKVKTQKALYRGPHRSCLQHIDFLEEEFIDMINKDQWLVLPYSEVKHLQGLRLSPPGVVPQRDRQPRWIGDYSWSKINEETAPLAPNEAMQFGHALDRFLRELLLADPKLGPIYLAKLDIADGFYRIDIYPDDIPKLALIFPTRPGNEPLVALPLVLPMGWKNSPPIFCAATETAADLANAALARRDVVPPPHPLELHAAKQDDPAPSSVPSFLSHARHAPSSATPRHLPASSVKILTSKNTPVPVLRDPSLPTSDLPTFYVDVFVDDFIAICQGHQNRSTVRQKLLHAVDQVFRPTDYYDNISRREPISLKKLKQGDCSWNTVKVILGWIIDTVAMTITLPAHRQERLGEILASIPPTQKRISIQKWHQLLGELRSMSIALPGARNMFSTMQEALSKAPRYRIALKKEVHQALQDFQWMHQDITNRPTRIAELVPLLPSALGYHDASGLGAGGVWYPTPELQSRSPHTEPLLWRLKWPKSITSQLITPANPRGTITNSDLELAGGLLHLDILAQAFDTRERTILSKTDNLATLYWQRKGSATTTIPPAHLLHLFGIHQRFHRYVPRHDYIPGKSNPMADDASRLFHYSNHQFLSYFNTTHTTQSKPYRLVTPTLPMSSAVISALLTRKSKQESLLVEPPPPIPTGGCGKNTQLSWASVPYSKPSKTKYQCYKSSSDAFAPVDLLPTNVKSALERLKITYGRLLKRSSTWGPQIPASTPLPTSTFA